MFDNESDLFGELCRESLSGKKWSDLKVQKRSLVFRESESQNNDATSSAETLPQERTLTRVIQKHMRRNGKKYLCLGCEIF